MMAHYKKEESLDKAMREHFLKNLEDRKTEITLFAVAYDLDTDMLKSLLAGGNLKELLFKP